MNFKLKKSGFTLSELMVTLALIGCLATLTLSTVGASIQQRARLAEFRTAYSRLQATLKDVNAERGNIFACYHGGVDNADIQEQGLRMTSVGNANKECNRFIQAFTRAMGAAHTCNEDPIKEGCIPNDYPSQKCAAYNFNNSKGAYVFDNSMILMVLRAPSNSDFAGMMAIDINGRKGPNKWGQDIFPISLSVSETATVNGVTYAKDVQFTHPQVSNAQYNSCFLSGAGKSTKTMIRESAGIR